MNNLREVAYLIDPALWVREVLGIEPLPWQQDFLRAPRGASILALTGRQIGKTSTAALGNGKCSLVHARFAQRGRLPCATPER